MYRGPGGMNPPPFRPVYGVDQVYTPDPHEPNSFIIDPNRCYGDCRNQHEHDIRYRVFLRRLLNYHCHLQGLLDLFDMGEGTFGCRAGNAWFHANYDAITHFDFLPRLIPMGGGGRHGGPRRPPGLRRGGCAGPSNQGRNENRGTGGHSGGALVRRHTGGGATGGAFGGGGGGSPAGGAFGGGGAGGRDSRGTQSASAAPPPGIWRALTTTGASQQTSGASGPSRRTTFPPAPPTKRYGDPEDMATR